MKKSKTLLGVGVELLAGAAAGAFIGHTMIRDPDAADDPGLVATVCGTFGMGLGALLGGITGAIAGKDEIIKIEESFPEESKEDLSKLKSDVQLPFLASTRNSNNVMLLNEKTKRLRGLKP